jgi:hypothetical protein
MIASARTAPRPQVDRERDHEQTLSSEPIRQVPEEQRAGLGEHTTQGTDDRDFEPIQDPGDAQCDDDAPVPWRPWQPIHPGGDVRGNGRDGGCHLRGRALTNVLHFAGAVSAQNSLCFLDSIPRLNEYDYGAACVMNVAILLEVSSSNTHSRHSSDDGPDSRAQRSCASSDVWTEHRNRQCTNAGKPAAQSPQEQRLR